MISITTIAEDIKAEALSLGFSLFGITTPKRPIFFDHYSKWLEKKQFGDMGYLNNPRAVIIRSDPTKYLVGCKSIMALGLPYFTYTNSNNTTTENKISFYALGKDYHRDISQKHEILISKIHLMLPNSNFNFKSAVDSVPVLEKSLAFSAGLGWIGRNGCLINPHHGSFFFLSEIFTTLDLPVSTAVIKDLCGNCRSCVTACPTQCINSDRTLNAKNCISYLTIEHKGKIAPTLQKKIGSKVFGCDICQIVCPWNQKIIKFNQTSAFQTTEINPNPNLEYCLRLSEDEFIQLYGHTPIKRTGYLRFLRNVIIALGNSGRKEYLESLKNFDQKNTNEELHSLAIWALRELGN